MRRLGPISPIPWRSSRMRRSGSRQISPVWFFLIAMIATGPVSLAVRLRRSSGIERQQLRWLVAALASMVIGMISGLIGFWLWPDLGPTGLFWFPAIIGLPLIPISIGIAVLRYRLYEIDVLVNRTVLYGLATLVVAVAFGAANWCCSGWWSPWRVNAPTSCPQRWVPARRWRLAADPRHPAAGRPGAPQPRDAGPAVHRHRRVHREDRGAGRRAVAAAAGPIPWRHARRAEPLRRARGEHGRRLLSSPPSARHRPPSTVRRRCAPPPTD